MTFGYRLFPQKYTSYNLSAGVRIGGAGEARPEGAEGHPAQ